MSSGSSCSGTEACRQPCPRDERHPDRSADSQSAQSDPARPSTTGLPQARHPPSPRPGAKAQQQPHKAAPQHRQGEPKGRSDRPLRPAPIPGTPLRVAPDPKAQSRQAKSQTPLCPSHAALEARPNSLISQRSSQYELFDLLNSSEANSVILFARAVVATAVAEVTDCIGCLHAGVEAQPTKSGRRPPA